MQEERRRQSEGRNQTRNGDPFVCSPAPVPDVIRLTTLIGIQLFGFFHHSLSEWFFLSACNLGSRPLMSVRRNLAHA